MPTLIKLKNSLNTAVPGSLANGEPAFTANGDILYIGSNGQIVPIAGKRVPGVLTANQAIVTNSTNMIDVLRVGNSTVNTIVLQNGIEIANSTVVFDLVLPSAAQQAGSFYLHANGSWVSVATSTPGGANTTLQFNDSGTLGGSAGLTFNKTTNNVTIANTLTIGSAVVNNTTFASGANVLLGLSGLFVGNTTVNGNFISTAISFANSTVSSNLQTGQLNIGANSIVNTTAMFTGNSTANAVQSATQITVANSTGTTTITPTTLTVQNLGGSQINTAANLSFTGANVSIPNANLAVKDLTVSGNLVVTGTLTSVDATNLQVTDSIIKLARNNAANALDIGFFGQYNDGASRFTGMIWDVTTSRYELFANTTGEPTTTLDTGGVGFTTATLRAFLSSGGLVSNATNVTITANSTLAVAITANTLSLTTALAGTSGGTGYTTYTAEDLLVANTTNGFRKLAFAANKVLQSNGTAILYDDVDGGTF